MLFLCSFGILALLARTFYIQISARDMQGHDLVASAVEQRREKFELDSGRGDVLDRDGHSLTGSSLNGIVVLPVWQFHYDTAKLNDLAMLLGTSTLQLVQALRASEEPFLLRLKRFDHVERVVALTEEEVRKVTDLNLTGIYAKQVKVRYDDNSLARHVVGFLGEDPNLVANTWGGVYPLHEQVGKLGIEYQYQHELRGLGKSSHIAYYTDAANRPINGLGLRETRQENHALTVQTTLHRDIQRSVEGALDRFQLQKGAVIVLDIASEDVLAMASRPNFDQNKPLPGGEFPVNRALSAYFPGSIFKSVIAAAALEQGVVKPDDVFECQGHIEIGDGKLNCWTTHGTLTARQAFAQSCNVAFAQMAMKLGREPIATYADKLGLGKPVGLSSAEAPQFQGEQAGTVFVKEGSSSRFLANTGIGQEDVRVTPLQAAHLMATVAKGGMAGAPRLVQSLHTAGDNLLYRAFDVQENRRVLNEATARALQDWMRGVVAEEKGTARGLAGAALPVAGKTGTAETAHANLHHHWFAGFAPFDQPKYAIVVMAEDVPDGTPRMTEQIVQQIVNALPSS